MPTHYPLKVCGARSGGGLLEVRAPFDDALIATVETADADAVRQGLDHAHGLFRDRDKWLTAAARIEILDRAAQIMAQRAEALAMEAAHEGGKPLVDSRVEVARAIDGLKLCAQTLRTDAGIVVPMQINAASMNRVAFTQREPIGVVVAISAFNHPLNLIVHQAGPAIAAGCPVIVKPAETTPLSCYRFLEILCEAGLPEGWMQVLTVRDLAVAEALATDRRVGFFSFIGSAKVGWMLRGRLAPGTRCALEHGGVAPVIVAADADLELAAPLLAKGGFYHAGQVCVSVQRVFAHESVAKPLADRLVALATALKVGDPVDPATEVGPFIRRSEVERVHAWVEEAVQAGARLLCGGERIGETCYAPTVLYDPPADSKVSTQEVFGPVICVYPFSRIDDAIARANSLPFAFQAAVFTRDIDTATRVYRCVDASAVMVNDHTAFRVDWMPFAGLRHSGLGVGGMAYTIRDMQSEKLMVIRSPNL
jgi:acyl-CoA reductase-like NAD-dependent aldehyde dehydrogenase